MNNISSYIGFALKSGKVVYGLDNIEKSNKRKLYLILFSSLSQNSLDKITNISEKNEITILKLKENILPKGVKIMAITEPNLAKVIKEKIENLEDC